MNTWLAALLALVVVVGGASLVFGGAALLIAGGIWVLDRVAQKWGEKRIDQLGAVFTILLLVFAVAIYWFAAFEWLTGGLG